MGLTLHSETTTLKDGKMKKQLLSTTTALLASATLFAGGDIAPVEPQIDMPAVETPSHYNVALKAGTLGVGLDISRMFSESFGLRANINGLTYNDNRDISDINYDTDLKLLTVGLLADYYPMESNFRISAGLYYNDNHADGTFVPTAGTTFEFGDNTYTAAEIGRIDAGAYYKDSVAPYVGFGWGNKSSSDGWGFTLDIGALYQGSTKVYADPAINAGLPANIRDQIKDDIEKERIQIEDDIKDYKWYPVIMLGINYSF